MASAAQAFYESLAEYQKTNLGKDAYTIISSDQLALLVQAMEDDNEESLSLLKGAYIAPAGDRWECVQVWGTDWNVEEYNSFFAAVVDAMNPDSSFFDIHAIDGSGYEPEIIEGSISVEEAAKNVERGISFEEWAGKKEKLIENVLNKVDSRGHIVLQIDEHDNAVLYNPSRQYDPYIYAFGYDFDKAEWSQGYYSKTLYNAVAHAEKLPPKPIALSQDEILELKRNINDLEDEKLTLEAEIRELRQDRKKLRDFFVKAKDDYNKLSGDFTRTLDEKAVLSQEISDLQSTILGLNEELQEARSNEVFFARFRAEVNDFDEYMRQNDYYDEISVEDVIGRLDQYILEQVEQDILFDVEDFNYAEYTYLQEEVERLNDKISELKQADRINAHAETLGVGLSTLAENEARLYDLETVATDLYNYINGQSSGTDILGYAASVLNRYGLLKDDEDDKAIKLTKDWQFVDKETAERVDDWDCGDGAGILLRRIDHLDFDDSYNNLYHGEWTDHIVQSIGLDALGEHLMVAAYDDNLEHEIEYCSLASNPARFDIGWKELGLLEQLDASRKLDMDVMAGLTKPERMPIEKYDRETARDVR